MMDQNYLDTAHLLRRAGFGAGPDETRAAASRGLAAVTDDLLHPERVPDPLNDDQIIGRLTDLIPEGQRMAKNGREYLPLQVVKLWWTIRLLASPHPLVEKMTLFWHGHFTSKDGGQAGDFMLRQNQMFRQNALGNFRTLTLAVSRDPEMLRYLNGNQNFKAHPNENYGRELMELYTCGIGHYTEDDVKAAARAFSGWNLRGGEFYFNARQHDNDSKTFLGKTGNWNGDDIVDILVAHPATAKRLCTQLFTAFAYPNPEPAVLDALTKTYYASGYDIRAILGQIFRSQAFYSARARSAVIKCPVQYVIGSVKMLGLAHTVPTNPSDISPANDMAAASASAGMATPPQQMRGRRIGGLAGLPIAMRAMGQDILDPPSVKGWDGGPAWINTATMMARLNFANTLSQSREAFGGQFVRAVNYVQQRDFTPEQWVDYLAFTLGPLQLTPQTRQTLIDYVNSAGEFREDAAPQVPAVQDIADAQNPLATPPGYRRARRFVQRPGPGGLEGRLRGVIPLMMATPEYQVC
ncbi:MAG: DUF1800 domain-containing protein [Armatimonadetes bacterium]|nr:DUF1800 domain-containing protein [Armatimonadota bacterium]